MGDSEPTTSLVCVAISHSMTAATPEVKIAQPVDQPESPALGEPTPERWRQQQTQFPDLNVEVDEFDAALRLKPNPADFSR
jgi:hypothetical protein